MELQSADVRSAIFFSVLKFFFTSSWSGKYDFDCGPIVAVWNAWLPWNSPPGTPNYSRQLLLFLATYKKGGVGY